MTNIDYDLITSAFAAEVKYWPHSHAPEAATALDCISERLAEALAKNNPYFDKGSFLAACGFNVE